MNSTYPFKPKCTIQPRSSRIHQELSSTFTHKSHLMTIDDAGKPAIYIVIRWPSTTPGQPLAPER